ncbi:Gfo/Idh/MocA family oxidoreductase [Lentibacter algarum]|uniref:Gfo/Idh/MocA family protein n=1 Tax=Lentibacter algarum TaxID=576131 RepID=UPI001C09CFFA|nr:Gfo/Idh/MocA family oxidoreductase [Lentibacter algarum]MBU2983337.1 Gfo/Idh/MocA family oxidoreductase [Lentibacter algarum]
MKSVAIVGCGFVADLYMRSLQTFPDIRVSAVFDRSQQRLAAFCTHWGVEPASSLDALLSGLPANGLLLNLTNPSAHYEINCAALEAGHHVFCEKPLALSLKEAQKLCALAKQESLQLGSAPSSVLGEAAQTLGYALRQGVGGTPRLIYAELDDGYIPQAPIQDWASESGAPWPYQDEFRVGCTLEHAGYYLSWLIAMFGPVSKVLASSSELVPDKRGVTGGAPDFSVAVLHFENGPVVRLTCSISAPHDHRFRVICDEGVIALTKAWDNAAPVKYHRRLKIRRRLLEHPLGRRIRLKQKDTHPKLPRTGAAAMNFALGPAEMLDAIAAGVPSRIAGDFALHLTEVTLAIQNSGDSGGAYQPVSRCEPMEPMPWAH